MPSKGAASSTKEAFRAPRDSVASSRVPTGVVSVHCHRLRRPCLHYCRSLLVTSLRTFFLCHRVCASAPMLGAGLVDYDALGSPKRPLTKEFRERTTLLVVTRNLGKSRSKCELTKSGWHHLGSLRSPSTTLVIFFLLVSIGGRLFKVKVAIPLSAILGVI